MSKHSPMSPNGQDDIVKNISGNVCLNDLIEERVSRRTVIKGGFALAASSFMGISLTGCSSNNDATTPATQTVTPKLTFSAVAKTTEKNALSIPTGYTAKVIYKLGDPIDGNTPNYKNDLWIHWLLFLLRLSQV